MRCSELGSADRAAGLRVIRDALRSWTPAIPSHNHHQALARLDWRWRLKDIATHFGLSSEKLDRDLADIQTRLSAPRLSDATAEPAS